MLHKVFVYETTTVSEINHIIETYDSPVSVFVACGGDGTVHAVAKLLAGRVSKLGVLPLGSGNDFAKMLGSDGSISSYLEILHTGNTACFDTIEWNNGICINTFGLGVDGLTNQYAAESVLFRGKLKYIVAAIKAIFKIDKRIVTIQINSQPVKYFTTYLCLISNGRWEGGSYQLSPNSKPDDGLFELHIAQIKSRLHLMNQFLRLSLFGSFSANVLKSFECTNVTLIFDKVVPAHCDGEIIQPTTELSFTLRPMSVNVLIKHNN